jgi:hypothetical protein
MAEKKRPAPPWRDMWRYYWALVSGAVHDIVSAQELVGLGVAGVFIVIADILEPSFVEQAKTHFYGWPWWPAIIVLWFGFVVMRRNYAAYAEVVSERDKARRAVRRLKAALPRPYLQIRHVTSKDGEGNETTEALLAALLKVTNRPVDSARGADARIVAHITYYGLGEAAEQARTVDGHWLDAPPREHPDRPIEAVTIAPGESRILDVAMRVVHWTGTVWLGFNNNSQFWPHYLNTSLAFDTPAVITVQIDGNVRQAWHYSLRRRGETGFEWAFEPTQVAS